MLPLPTQVPLETHHVALFLIIDFYFLVLENFLRVPVFAAQRSPALVQGQFQASPLGAAIPTLALPYGEHSTPAALLRRA